MKIGNKEFDFQGNHVYVMGILNVTPDSFSDGGRFQEIDQAMYHVEEMVEQGADLIDIGGESTRPGYQKIGVEEEMERVTGVIRAVKERFDLPVSIDTYKAPVMDAALSAGADLANDIWGLRYDSLFAEDGKSSVWKGETLAQVVARHRKPVCIMHNRKVPGYRNLLEEMVQDLNQSLMIAEEVGIASDQIILDPGIGFGKTYENNMEVLANLDYFNRLNMPLLLAASRKSVIGLSLDLPVDQREEGTMVTSVLAAQHGWDMIRVHDVEKNVRAVRMMEKIREYREIR